MSEKNPVEKTVLAVDTSTDMLACAVARVAAALPFDLMHGAATVVFLGALYVPWTRRIERVVRKFDLRG